MGQQQIEKKTDCGHDRKGRRLFLFKEVKFLEVGIAYFSPSSKIAVLSVFSIDVTAGKCILSDGHSPVTTD